MDLYCQYCGEPWELLGITDEFSDMEKRVFHSGKGCPCCYSLDPGATHPAEGHHTKIVDKKPFRSELQETLRSALGGDLDGLAAEMEDAEMMFGSEFND